MYPHERSLVKEYANRPFALLGVNSDSDREGLKDILVEKDISWRSWWDGGDTSGPIATHWNVRGWPTTYVIDADGVIRYKQVRGDDLDEAVEKLVAEAEKATAAEAAAKKK